MPPSMAIRAFVLMFQLQIVLFLFIPLAGCYIRVFHNTCDNIVCDCSIKILTALLEYLDLSTVKALSSPQNASIFLDSHMYLFEIVPA